MRVRGRPAKKGASQGAGGLPLFHSHAAPATTMITTTRSVVPICLPDEEMSISYHSTVGFLSSHLPGAQKVTAAQLLAHLREKAMICQINSGRSVERWR